MNIDFSLLENINTSPSGLDSPEHDELLTLQTQKVDLVQQRDALAAKRLEIKENIDRLNLTLAHYKLQHHQYETRQKLEYYLQQNDHEYSKLAAPDAAAGFVLENLHVLPSRDWNLRMLLIGRLLPCLEVRDSVQAQVYENGALVAKTTYTAAAKDVPSLHITVYAENEAVKRVEVDERASLLLHKISSTYGRSLKNYTRQGKIDLLMYSYHSLAQQQQRRISILQRLMTEYEEKVLYPKDTSSLALRTAQYVELLFSTFTVRLYWGLVLEDSIVGEVESKLELVVMNGDGLVLNGVNNVFLGLVAEHGVFGAFQLMVRNMFEL